MGQPFKMLYIVNSGFLKSTVIDEQGNEQILGFPMKNDLLCTDGIYLNRHVSEAIALTECDLIMLPFKQLVSLTRTYTEMEGAVYSMMSREVVREQAMHRLLASSSAEVRVTRFLVDLSDKFGQLGYSRKTFNLRMTRQEIGSYLGLTLETVSRTLSTLNTIGLVTVYGKTIELNDINALRSFRKLLPVDNLLKRQEIYMQKIMRNKLVHPVAPLKLRELHTIS
jgi:CRP/FNR family transcriptional regulator